MLTRLILKRIVGYDCKQHSSHNNNNHQIGLNKIINYMITSIDQYIHTPSLIPALSSASSSLLSSNNISNNSNDINTLLDGIWFMGVPKSKVSPSRKRMKHLQHVPDKIGWLQCKKCGEPKRPHRICTKHIDICAMRDDEYEAKKALTK